MKGPPSAPRTPRISVQMIDADIISRVADLFGVKAAGPRLISDYKPIFTATLKGARAIALMHLLHPLMGARRRGQIDRAIQSADGARHHVTEIQAGDVLASLRSGARVSKVVADVGLSKTTINRLRRGAHRLTS